METVASRLYAVQHCHKMRGWEDLVYFAQWATAVRASELAAQKQPGLVTRVTRKPHGFVPPVAPVTPVLSIGSDTPVDFIQGHVDPEPASEEDGWEAEKLRKRHQKKLARAAAATARIPTWYDRINSEE